MAAPQPSPPAKKRPQLPPTTITALDQDALREIFPPPALPHQPRPRRRQLPRLPRRRPFIAFRRQFRALHPPPLLGLFIGIRDAVTPAFVPLLRRSDPDLAAALRGADFFLTRLPLHEDDAKENTVSAPVPVPKDGKEDVVSVSVPVAEQDEDAVSVTKSEDDDEDAFFEWSIRDCRDGFVVLDNWSIQQIAVYNPLTRTMDLFPRPPREDDDGDGLYLDFYILASEQDRRCLFRIVCVWHGDHGARVVVLSSDTRKWQIFPLTDINGCWPHHGNLVNGCIYWTVGMPDARVLNTATMQFSRMDMPLNRGVDEMLTAGETKDGRLCVVSTPTVSLTFESALVVWIWRDGYWTSRFFCRRYLGLFGVNSRIMLQIFK